MGGRFTLRRLDAIDAFAEQVAYVHENGLHGLEEWVVRRYFSECISRTRMLVDASYIFEKLREKEKARIVSQARAILFRYGLPHLSLLDDYDYYAFVLPHFIVRAVRAPLTLPRRLRKTAATHG